MQTRVVIFDKDGTLMDFDSFWQAISKAAVDEILKKTNMPPKAGEEITEAFGVHNGVSDITGILYTGTYAQMGEAVYNVLKKYGCTLSLSEITKLSEESSRNNYSAGVIIPACENIESVLSEFTENGIRLAVATTDSPSATEECLTKFGIKHLFEFVYTDDGHHPPKPDPYCINDICSQLNVTKEEIVMVGDTTTDTRLAKNGGIRCIGIAKTEKNASVLRKETDTVVKDISQVFKALL